MRKIPFTGEKILILGSGSIAATVLPMILDTLELCPEKILIASNDERHREIRVSLGVSYLTLSLQPGRIADNLLPLVRAGDMVLNLTVGVGSLEVIEFCLKHGVSYIDTSLEQWSSEARHADSLNVHGLWSQLTGRKHDLPRNATALASHGANPGLVSHFAKQALLDIARENDAAVAAPKGREDWSRLAYSQKVRAIHISERDTQRARMGRGATELVNTWSVEGLLEEAFQNACFAWGTHERSAPGGMSITRDASCSVVEGVGYAKDLKVRSWLPSRGEFHASVIPHEETFTIATLLSNAGNGEIKYQPTVLFAYQPCDAAVDSLNSYPYLGDDAARRVMIDEIHEGVDELGVLILREGCQDVYWFGSTLDSVEAQSLVPFSNATTLQVAAGVIGGMVWVLENPKRGLVEPEDADHERVLEVARPYLGKLGGHRQKWGGPNTNWTFSQLLVPSGGQRVREEIVSTPVGA